MSMWSPSHIPGVDKRVAGLADHHREEFLIGGRPDSKEGKVLRVLVRPAGARVARVADVPAGVHRPPGVGVAARLEEVEVGDVACGGCRVVRSMARRILGH
eukprot:2833058-Pyramimonas_sp.AAC.1